MNMNDLFAAVMALDLAPIKFKLMHVESGEGWSLAKADAVEKEYRRFLCLMKLYPEEDTAPLVDVDTFWHYHILDTMKYASDCQQAFGYFLHHYPYVGMRSDNDEQFRIDSGDRMRTLYETTFGEAYPSSYLERAPRMQASAYRARFGIALQADAMIAWCASPGGKQVARSGAASNDATAWCASPGSQDAAQAAGATAWCASPGSKQIVRGAASNDATAWCASPGSKGAVQGATATAWCASPGTKQATRGAASNDATAWCASPGSKDAAQAASATAWCASPGKQASLGSATAWCASPGAKTIAQAA